ncbi:MAG TPA: hypothetical protein VFA33_14350 [Bryobacteraceae bacterium]|nr:hypothetical protein [Bryobacteraceae bacterium]
MKLGFVFVAVACSSPLSADLMNPFTSSSAYAADCTNLPCTTLASQVLPGDAATVSGTSAAGSGAYSFGASASASFGVLKVASSSALSTPISPVSFVSSGDALFVDIVTIDSGPQTGEPGLLALAYTLDGVIAQSGSISSAAVITAIVGAPPFGSLIGGPNFQQAMYTTPISGKFEFPQLFSFTYGTPFNLYLEMNAGTGTEDFVSSGGVISGIGRSTTVAGSGNVDFSNTATLSGLHTFDAQGNPVLNPVFTSVSGTRYTANGVVAEPSSLILIVPGVLCLLALRRKRVYPVASGRKSLKLEGFSR